MATLNNLISFTSAGINTTTFTEIRAALVQKYQDVYGSDIDLSTGSADGVFVNELALIMNNIIQTCAIAYSNLDINQAQGIYLDSLCALSNVFRKQPTKSSASLTITNIGNSNVTLDNPVFVDSAGELWDYSGTISLTTTSPGNSVSIIVYCRTAGPVQAPSGWIIKTVDASIPIMISQPNAAIIGTEIETDEDLRARRAQSSGADGTTTIESIIGALLQLDEIYDVKVYNNNSDSSETIAGDGTTVEEHSIYVAIHKNPNVTIEDETIGMIIHQKLTPGVKTTPSTSLVGIAKSWQFIDNVYGRQVVESIENIYWKECEGIHLPITIKIDNLFHFNANTCTKIGENVIKYVNNLSIGYNLYDARIFSGITNAVNAADPGYRGSDTFTINNINVSSSINPWEYYNYSTITPSPDYQTPGDDTTPLVGYTITIS